MLRFPGRTAGGGTAPPTPTPIATPSLLSPANNARLPLNQSIPFSWSAVTYEIQFDDSSSFTTPLIAAQIGLTQTQTTQTFTSKRRFWWRVRAQPGAAATFGNWSAVRSFDIKRGAPSLPTSTRTPTAIGPSTTRTPTAIPSPTNTRTPTTVAADTISIQLAEDSAGNQQLHVEATGSNASRNVTLK